MFRCILPTQDVKKKQNLKQLSIEITYLLTKDYLTTNKLRALFKKIHEDNTYFEFLLM
jgi:hypothetical protein